MDFEIPTTKRHYSDEEKRQLIANLDIEVAHRTRQFEAWLADRLENFTLHQEGQVSRIPKQVRGMTMREFGEKYEGNIQSALRGYQKERLVAAGVDSSFAEIDKSMRKRKWVASQETEAEAGSSKDTDAQRALKNARTQLASPKKAGSSTGPGTAQRSRMLSTGNKTPVMSRALPRAIASPSPQKARAPFSTSTSLYPRPTSPAKPGSSKPTLASQQRRVPSSSSFNPSLQSKGPAYPPPPLQGQQTMMRLPRKDENMLSVNGSPLANPYEFGLGWFKGIEMAELEAEDDETQHSSSQQSMHSTQNSGRQELKRTKSGIIIRRDPSAVMSGLHSRTESQASFYTATSYPESSAHSRDPSQSTSNLDGPKSNLGSFRFPSNRPTNMVEQTPKPATKHTRSFSALVAIPTKDGQVLEFDPLQTSPGALDALEGITDSAKKQAKAEMGRLIQATVDKWKLDK